MIRPLIIVANLFIALLIKLVADGPTAEVKAPASVNAGESFLVEVNIQTNGVKDFMRFSMEFPAGWKAEKVEDGGATFMFEKNSANENYSAKFLWSRVGEQPQLKISYRVTSPATANGDMEFPCKISRTVNNLPDNIQLTPLKVHFNNSNSTQPVVTHPNADSTAKPAVTISVVRTVPSGEQSGQFLVDLVINKEDLTNFGKLEDSLPEGFSAKKVMTDGSDFTFDKGKVKFSWWVMPKRSMLHVQYMVVASPDVSGPQTITGIFSYVENESGKIYQVANSTVTMKASQALIVENNNNQQQQQEENANNTKQVNSQEQSQQNNTQETAKENTQQQQVVQQAQQNNNQQEQQQQQQQETQQNNLQANVNKSVAGVTYSVQIAAMSRMVPVQYFSSTFNLGGTVNAEQVDGLNKYTHGSFQTYQDARNHREELRGKGVEGPFVTAYNGAKRITVQEALMITSEKWVR